MELMEDAVNVLVAFFLGASDVGVKGAVGALAPAEREMDVEVQAGVDASPLGEGFSSAGVASSLDSATSPSVLVPERSATTSLCTSPRFSSRIRGSSTMNDSPVRRCS